MAIRMFSKNCFLRNSAKIWCHMVYDIPRIRCASHKTPWCHTQSSLYSSARISINKHAYWLILYELMYVLTRRLQNYVLTRKIQTSLFWLIQYILKCWLTKHSNIPQLYAIHQIDCLHNPFQILVYRHLTTYRPRQRILLRGYFASIPIKD